MSSRTPALFCFFLTHLALSGTQQIIHLEHRNRSESQDKNNEVTVREVHVGWKHNKNAHVSFSKATPQSYCQLFNT